MLDSALLPYADDRTALRPLCDADVAAYVAGTEDPEVRRFAHLPEPVYTPELVREIVANVAPSALERGDLALLAIAEVVSGRFAGSLVIFDVSEAGAEVGFWLHPQYRGGGHAGRALAHAAEFARESGMRELRARTELGNASSQRVLERAGFSETGRSAGAAPSGRAIEAIHYALAL